MKSGKEIVDCQYLYQVAAGEVQHLLWSSFNLNKTVTATEPVMILK